MTRPQREQVAAFLGNNRALWLHIEQKKEYFTLAFGKMEQKNDSTDWLEIKTQPCLLSMITLGPVKWSFSPASV